LTATFSGSRTSSSLLPLNTRVRATNNVPSSSCKSLLLPHPTAVASSFCATFSRVSSARTVSSPFLLFGVNTTQRRSFHLQRHKFALADFVVTCTLCSSTDISLLDSVTACSFDLPAARPPPPKKPFNSKPLSRSFDSIWETVRPTIHRCTYYLTLLGFSIHRRCTCISSIPIWPTQWCAFFPPSTGHLPVPLHHRRIS
jgi:hypothetical protein